MTEARKEKGITLVALVVTIIILIILATISINAISGENSLIKKVQKEKEDYAESSKREDEKLGSMAEEYKYLTTPREPMEKPIPEGAISFGNISWENGLAKIQVVKNTEEYQLQYQVVKKGKSIVDSDWTTVEDKKANTVEVKELDLGDQVVARLWDGNKGGKNVTSLEVKDGEKPKVNITGADSTTNSITITITATDDESGMGSNPKYKYYIKQKDGQYGEVQEDTKLTHTFTGLNQTKEYIVKVEVEDRAGNLQTKEKEGTITTKTIPSAGDGIQTGAITFKDLGWKNKKVSVDITKTDTNYYLQWQKVASGSSLNNNWTTEQNKTTNLKNITGLELGDQVVARLWDGTQFGSSATFTVKDGVNPSATINLNNVTNIKKGEKIKATVTLKDNESGINLSKCKWILHTQKANLGTEDSKYNTGGYARGTFNAETQTIDNAISTEGTYYLHVLSVDMTGTNKVETVSGAITVKTQTVEDFKGVTQTTTTTIPDSLGNDVVIPGGFKIADDSGKNVEEGIVIEDDSGNQFVWIPVSNIDGDNNESNGITGTAIKTSKGNVEITLGRYTFECIYDNSKYDVSTNFRGSGLPTLIQKASLYADETGLSNSAIRFIEQKAYSVNSGTSPYRRFTAYNLYNTSATAEKGIGFINSAEKYHGFYIGRFEASYASGTLYSLGTDTKYAKPQVKVSTNAPTNAWNYTYKTGDLWTSILQERASFVSINMYYKNSFVTSDLVNSYMWDTAIVYIQKMGNNNYANRVAKDYLTNTGTTDDKVCNIFDLSRKS